MLFLIISCLALVPLATLYILLAVTCFLFSEMVVYEEGEHDFTFSSALAALRICTQATLYFSLSFPFMVALLSTFGCYHILEARRRVVYSTDTGSPSVDFSPIIWLYLQRYSMVSLCEHYWKISISTLMGFLTDSFAYFEIDLFMILYHVRLLLKKA